MAEVPQVYAQLEPPSTHNPAGRVVLGYYVLADDVVTMTDQSGKTAEDAEGRTYSEKLEPSGESPGRCGTTDQEVAISPAWRSPCRLWRGQPAQLSQIRHLF
jgi:hypothetical protein